jgi:group I intron endonuclease
MQQNNIKKTYLSEVEKELQIKYGKESFIRENMFIFDNREDALKMESKLVDEKLINNLLCLNITKGGKGNVTPSETQSEESNIKRSIKLKGKPSGMKNKKHTQESKNKISKSLMGRVPYNKGLKLPEEHKLKMRRPASNKGVPASEEQKKKQSQSMSHTKKKICIDDVIFISIREASKILKIHRSTIKNRLKNNKWSSWNIL